MANTGNTQQIIDYGATANDGTGDPLRTAFIKTDENFSNIWLAGPVGSNITIANNTIQANDTNGNIIIKPNGIGIVQTNASIVPDLTQSRDLGSANNRFRSLYFAGNIDTTGDITAGNIVLSGGISLDGDITVNGNLTVNGTTLTVNVANLDISDKMIVIANGSPNAQSANGAGITIDGANASITYLSGPGVLEVNTPWRISSQGNTWEFNDNRMATPAGGFWVSREDLRTEYINSPDDGFINLIAYNHGNLASELYMEHGFVRIRVDNGGPEQDWLFNLDGTMSVPGDIIPSANGTQNLGNSTNRWAELWVSGNLSSGNISALDVSSRNIFNSLGVYGQFGGFTGLNGRGIDAIQAGVLGGTFLGTDVIAQFTGNSNAYTQFNFQNINTGTQASTDYVITANNGNDTTHFLNIGLTNSNWDGTQDNSLGNLLGPNDGYFYIQDGNLAIGTKSGVDSFVWKFDTTGNVSADGNLIPAANGVYSLGSSTNYWSNLWVANNTIYIGGVPLGVSGNVLTVDGQPLLSNDSNTSISTTGNIVAESFAGDGSLLTSITGANVTGLANVATSGNYSDLSGTPSNVSAFANDAGYITANVTGDISATGNIAADYFFGDGSQLTGIETSTIFNGNSNVEITTANGNVVVSVDNDVASWTFATDGTIYSKPETNYKVIATDPNGNSYVISHAINDGAQDLTRTSLNYDSFNIETDLANGGHEWRYQGNTLQVTKNSRVTGYNSNVAIQSIYGGDRGTASLQSVSNENDSNIFTTFDATTTGANISVYNGGSVGGTGYTWRFDNTGNLSAPGNINAEGTVTADGLVIDTVAGITVQFGDVDIQGTTGLGGNINAVGANISGNVTADYFIGDGSQLTGLPAQYSDANVSSFLSAFGSNNIVTTGNITAGNLSGNISITGNVTGTSANVTLIAGSYSYVFDNTGLVAFPVAYKTTPVVVNALPNAATVGAGARAFVTDANSTTFGNLLVGGGIYYLPVFSNGANWYIG